METDTTWLNRLRAFYLTLDLRSLGLFRILMAAMLLADCLRRWAWIDQSYVAGGELTTNLAAHGWLDYWMTPLAWIPGLDSPWGVRLFFLLAMACYLLLLLGYRTRWTAALSLVAYASLVHGCPRLVEPGNFLFGSLMLWSLLLPLGERFSLDAFRRDWKQHIRLPMEHAGTPQRDEPAVAADRQSPVLLASLGVVLQIAAVHLLHAWAGKDDAEVFGPVTVLVEVAAAVLILVPLSAWPRRLGMLLLAALYVRLAVAGNYGLFPFVGLAGCAVLLSCADWKQMADCLARLSPSATVYYDDSCGICDKSCQMLTALDRFSKLSFIGSSDIENYRHEIPEGLTEKTVVVFDEASGRRYTKASAAARAMRALPLPWHFFSLMAVPGVRQLCDVAYDAFAARRHRVSQWLGLAACGVPIRKPQSSKGGEVSKPPPAPVQVLSNILAALVMVALAWNGCQELRSDQETPRANESSVSPLLPGEGPTIPLLREIAYYPTAIQRWSDFRRPVLRPGRTDVGRFLRLS